MLLSNFVIEINPYESHYSEFIIKLRQLTWLNETFPKVYEDEILKNIEPLVKALREHDENNLQVIVKKIQEDISKGKISINGSSNTNIAPSEQVADIAFSHQMNPLVREMSLVYMITIFKQFLKVILAIVFSKEPQSLKSGKEMMTYEEILKNNNIEEIKAKMIDRETNSIINQNMKDVNNDLNYFKLDLSGEPRWKEFCERFERRHVLVHNNGIADKKYVEATSEQDKLGKKLDVDQSYLSESLNIFEKFSNVIMIFFKQKYH